MPKGTEFWLFLFSVAAWPTTTVTVHDHPIHRRPTYLDLITTSVLGSEGKRGLQQVPVTWYDRFGVVNVEKQIILPIRICVQCFFRIFAFFCLFFFQAPSQFRLVDLVSCVFDLQPFTSGFLGKGKGRLCWHCFDSHRTAHYLLEPTIRSSLSKNT